MLSYHEGNSVETKARDEEEKVPDNDYFSKMVKSGT